MKRFQQQMPLMTAALLLLGMLTVAGAFNYLMNRHIERQAQAAIQQEMTIVNNSEETEGLTPSPVQTGMLHLKKDYSLSPDYVETMFASPLEVAIAAAIKASPPPDGQLRQMHLAGSELFVMQTQMAYEGLYADEIIVVYANMTPLKQLLGSVNLLFLLGSLVFAAVAGVAGAGMGRRIDSTQEQMKKFFQNASHELKTPLMSIQGYAEGIQTGLIPGREGADIILQQSDRMTHTIEEILHLSRLDSGQVHLRRDRLDGRELLYACAAQVDGAATKKNVRLQLGLQDGALMVMGDEGQLFKALTNVMSNAVRYAAQTVTITCRRAQGVAWIQISDDGPGIPPKELAHVFERFFAGQGGNTGIGLSLAEEIIRLHQGRITANNLPQGARFDIWLPLAPKANKQAI